MSIRSMLVAAAFVLASLETAQADSLRAIDAKSIDLGDVSGVAYYTVERDGFHVVMTLAQGMEGTPIRVVSVLASGQSVVGPLASEDEFTIVVSSANGARQTYQKSAVKFKIDDPMSAHFDLLGKYTDDDMHNVFAYLDTMK